MSASVNHCRMFAQTLLSICDENDAAIKHATEQRAIIKAQAEKIEALQKTLDDIPGRCPNCDWRSA